MDYKYHLMKAVNTEWLSQFLLPLYAT